jgi:hypothetical protein
MKIEQLKSLNEDEVAMLWFMVNKVSPQVLAGIEMELMLFTSIRHDKLIQRIDLCEKFIKEEHKHIFVSLKNKLSS